MAVEREDGLVRHDVLSPTSYHRGVTSTASHTELLAEGAIVADRYRVLGLLGQGGMGAVYRVEHVHMRKLFALKVLLADALRVPEIIARFEREAIAAASIEHPNVAKATDFGKLHDGSFFLVLELVDGRSLRSELESGPLAPVRATRIVRGIASAVAAAHAKEIVHRDLKPENVMLVQREDDADFVKVLDFGIAKVAAPEDEIAEASPKILTRVGAVMGTPDYMPPEQALGERVDARSDLYSLGVIFYELLAGVRPFRGETAAAILRSQLVDPVPPLPPGVGASPELVAIVTKLLAKEPGARFGSAAELVARLDEALLAPAAPVVPLAPSPAVSTSSVTTDPEPVAATQRRKRLVLGASFGGALVAVVLVGLASGSETLQVAEPFTASAEIARLAAEDGAAAARAAAARAAAARPAAAQDNGAPGSGTSSGSSRATPSAAPARTRKTGPGGIYIPPIKDWFK